MFALAVVPLLPPGDLHQLLAPRLSAFCCVTSGTPLSLVRPTWRAAVSAQPRLRRAQLAMFRAESSGDGQELYLSMSDAPFSRIAGYGALINCLRREGLGRRVGVNNNEAKSPSRSWINDPSGLDRPELSRGGLRSSAVAPPQRANEGSAPVLRLAPCCCLNCLMACGSHLFGRYLVANERSLSHDNGNDLGGVPRYGTGVATLHSGDLCDSSWRCSSWNRGPSSNLIIEPDAQWEAPFVPHSHLDGHATWQVMRDTRRRSEVVKAGGSVGGFGGVWMLRCLGA